MGGSIRWLLVLVLALAGGCDEPAPPSGPVPAPAESQPTPPVRPAPQPPSREAFEARFGATFEWVGFRAHDPQVNPAFPVGVIELRARAEGSEILALRDPAGREDVEHAWVVVAPPGPRELPPRPEDVRVCVGDTILLQVPIAAPPREWVAHDPGSVAARGIELGERVGRSGDDARLHALEPHLVRPRLARSEGETRWTLVRYEAAEPGTATTGEPGRPTVTVVAPDAPVRVGVATSLPGTDLGQVRPGDVVFLRHYALVGDLLGDPLGGL